jgi:hypothetical protein
MSNINQTAANQGLYMPKIKKDETTTNNETLTNVQPNVQKGNNLGQLAANQGLYNPKITTSNDAITKGPAMTSSIRATPATPQTNILSIFSPPPAIKTATPDIVLFDEETLGVDEIVDLIFENLSGQELINISRSDIINGQKITYQPIKNLSKIQQIYNSNNIISLQQTEDKYFAGFSIKLENKIPNEGNGENGKNVYIDEQTGDLIIEFVNLNNDEQIETQITLSGTIYEINLGDYTS